jgi:hypothetical protein
VVTSGVCGCVWQILYGARRAREPLAAYLKRLRDAGVDSIPGTSAEILVDDVRAVLAKGRCGGMDEDGGRMTSGEIARAGVGCGDRMM